MAYIDNNGFDFFFISRMWIIISDIFLPAASHLITKKKSYFQIIISRNEIKYKYSKSWYFLIVNKIWKKICCRCYNIKILEFSFLTYLTPFFSKLWLTELHKNTLEMIIHTHTTKKKNFVGQFNYNSFIKYSVFWKLI